MELKNKMFESKKLIALIKVLSPNQKKAAMKQLSCEIINVI